MVEILWLIWIHSNLAAEYIYILNRHEQTVTTFKYMRHEEYVHSKIVK